MYQEHEYDGVDLESGAGKPGSAGNVVVNEIMRGPPSHEGVKSQRRRDGRALEVARLARGVLGNVGRCDVETGQTGKPREDEDGKAYMVEGRLHTDGKGHAGWRQTKGYLLFCDPHSQRLSHKWIRYARSHIHSQNFMAAKTSAPE